uniref:Uncharacterized protein n=1 Tax=Rhizophagus irregularis (strain DAOM 181602 / DAOM 197198 / MUCL 43194) TaxID=747089 RepID=U9SY95_RHIID
MDENPFERFHANWELLYSMLLENGKVISLLIGIRQILIMVIFTYNVIEKLYVIYRSSDLPKNDISNLRESEQSYSNSRNCKPNRDQTLRNRGDATSLEKFVKEARTRVMDIRPFSSD